MGLISELMCKHTYHGKPLPPNIVFIAACNPYRIGTKNKIEKIGLNADQAHKEKEILDPKEKQKLKKAMNNTLVYTVNPLPHSLLNFVFNFGNLTEEDEKSYIEKITSESINKIYKQINGDKEDIKEKEELKKIHKLAVDMIVSAQNYIRKDNDISSVSLREIRRFNIFYEFFYDYLKKKKEMNTDLLENKQLDNKEYEFYQNLNSYNLQIYSIIMAVFVCYYLRITENDTRKELEKIMNVILEDFDKSYNDFLKLPLEEELFIANNIELEKGIAKNRALLDNIFALFIAINNKVPIFIVGKPGCSKSLSVQLINKSMKGKVSNNYIFKQYPKLIINSYQGSMGSTSKGVKKIFKKARNTLKRLTEENRKDNISMIFFDEMGLAEHSPNNPLKVIHSELEYDLNEGVKKIAFVGISNWVLDASKMNRGMFLSIPDLDEEDSKKTAFTIGESYDQQLAKQYQNYYENLGTAYFKYKRFLKVEHNQDGKEEFHGNRDFYHLIKIFARKMIKYEKRDIDPHVIESYGTESIERNFGGLRFDGSKNATSIEKIKNIYSQMHPNVSVKSRYDVLKRITENINDIKSRYLLVISKSSVSTFLISSILTRLKKEYSYYIGSPFINDLQSEEYSLKLLNKIQMNMEQGNVLILKHLESVYPALYDLFNQNFTEVNKKNYARIAIGSSNNAFSYVNNNFRCIVSVDDGKEKEEEPPLLNRFEKHIISFEYLLGKELKDESERIHGIINELCNCNKDEYKGINYDLRKTLVSNDLEDIQGIIYQASKNGVNKNDMITEVIKKISLILPQDIILCQKINRFQSNNPDLSDQIIKEYNKGEHSNLRCFLEKMENMKNVVYTFSNILDVIELSDFNNEKLEKEEKITINNIKNIKISSFKSENEFEKEIDHFLLEKKFKICLINFNSNEGNFLNYVKYFIENKEKDYKKDEGEENYRKAFVFIVHIKRIFDSEFNLIKKKSTKEIAIFNQKNVIESLSLLSEYYQIFIDNLNGDEELTLNKMMNYKGVELFNKILDLNKSLRKNIYTSLSYMKYNIPSSLGKLNENTYVEKLILFIEHNQELIDDINECIMKQMSNEEDLIYKALKEEGSVKEKDKDMINIIKEYLSNYYIKKLNYFYFKAEQDQFFSSLLSKYELDTKNKNESKNKIIIEGEEVLNKGEENENVKNVLKNTVKVYLKELVFTENDDKDKAKFKIVENPGAYKLDIILGLKLPGVGNIIDSIIKKVRNDVVRYYKANEKTLRVYLEEENKIKEKEKKYNQFLKAYNSYTFVELDKNTLISKIATNKFETFEFYELFLEDYYLLFIKNNIDKDKKNDNNNEKKEDNIDYISLKKIISN